VVPVGEDVYKIAFSGLGLEGNQEIRTPFQKPSGPPFEFHHPKSFVSREPMKALRHPRQWQNVALLVGFLVMVIAGVVFVYLADEVGEQA
jgi:hypothetical protein